MPDALSVEVVDAEGQVIVQLKGEIDITTAGWLRDTIEPFLGPNQTIVMDLSQITFADSSMLGALVRARGELTARGGSLLLRNPSEQARRLLTIGELDDLISDEVDRHNQAG